MPERLSVTIRELRAEDIPALTAIYNQPLIAAGTLQIPFHSQAERQERWQNSPSQRHLVAESDGRVVGDAGLTLLARRRAHVGGIGMAVDQAFHGRGVGTALMQALMDLADNWYNLRRLELQVYTDNEAGIRLYQRFGFVIEGTHRAYAWRNGAWADAYAMARLRDEPPLAAPPLSSCA